MIISRDRKTLQTPCSNFCCSRWTAILKLEMDGLCDSLLLKPVRWDKSRSNIFQQQKTVHGVARSTHSKLVHRKTAGSGFRHCHIIHVIVSFSILFWYVPPVSEYSCAHLNSQTRRSECLIFIFKKFAKIARWSESSAVQVEYPRLQYSVGVP